MTHRVALAFGFKAAAAARRARDVAANECVALLEALGLTPGAAAVLHRQHESLVAGQVEARDETTTAAPPLARPTVTASTDTPPPAESSHRAHYREERAVPVHPPAVVSEPASARNRSRWPFPGGVLVGFVAGAVAAVLVFAANPDRLYQLPGVKPTGVKPTVVRADPPHAMEQFRWLGTWNVWPEVALASRSGDDGLLHGHVHNQTGLPMDRLRLSIKTAGWERVFDVSFPQVPNNTTGTFAIRIGEPGVDVVSFRVFPPAAHQ
jgi:hypothetical protein